MTVEIGPQAAYQENVNATAGGIDEPQEWSQDTSSMTVNIQSSARGEEHPQIAYCVGPDSLEIRFPSELHLAGEVIQAATGFGRQFGINPHRLSIVLRELLRNAIEHGNGGDGMREVVCSVTCEDANSLRVTVRDEGNGFDFSRIDFALPENGERLEQRGLILVNAYAMRLAFNDSGNEISAYLEIAPEEEAREARAT